MSFPYDPDWEASLTTRLRRERSAVLAEVFERFRSPVVRLARGLTRDQHEAEDAAQEVFVAVVRGLGRWRGEARLGTWIYRITVRTAARVRSRRDRAQDVLPEELPGPLRPDPGVVADEMRRLSAALERLPETHRVVLVMVAIEGLSQQDAAEVLGVPVGTIWSRLSLARKRLVQELGR